MNEVMVDLMTRPPTTRVTNWEAYLARATRNKAIDRLRSAHARHAGGPLDQTDHDLRGVDGDVADTVAERVDDQRDAARVWDALPLLDLRDRQILWQYKGVGRTRADVARQFSISPARVSQITNDCLKILRDHLDHQGGAQR